MKSHETEPLEADPKKVVEEPYDCIWVVLKDRRKPTPLEAEPLQWVDWKLRGSISRYLAEATYKEKGVTYLPTFGKIATPLLALDSKQSDIASAIEATAQGMKLKSILCYFEDDDSFAEGRKELKRLAGREYPTHIFLAHGRGGETPS